MLITSDMLAITNATTTERHEIIVKAPMVGLQCSCEVLKGLFKFLHAAADLVCHMSFINKEDDQGGVASRVMVPANGHPCLSSRRCLSPLCTPSAICCTRRERIVTLIMSFLE